MGIHARFALSNRREIEDEIERLLALLDAADAPFADLEPEVDEAADYVRWDMQSRAWVGEPA